MKYYELIMETMLDNFFQETTSQLFNRIGIEKRIQSIQNQPSKADATTSFKMFVTEMLAIVDPLLTVNNSDFQNQREDGPAPSQQSAKAITKLLNAGKLVTRTGDKLLVNVDKYLKIEYFKKNNGLQLLLSLLGLKSILVGLSVYLNMPHDPLDPMKDIMQETELSLLNKDKDQATEILEKSLEIFERFDQDLKKLYQCTASLIFSKLYSCVLSPTMDTGGSDELFYQFRTSFALRPAVFLLGNYPSQKSIDTQLELDYLNSLSQIRKFRLKLNKNEKNQLPPEVFSEKQRIANAFNKAYQEFLKTLKPFLGENFDIEKNSVHSVGVMLGAPVETKVDEAFPLTILARDATLADYPASSTLKISLISDNENLLTRSEIAYKLGEARSFIIMADYVFANTPRHLFLAKPAVLISDLEIYIKKLEDEAAEVKTKYEKFIESLQNDIHKFSDSPFLVDIANHLHKQIFPSLQTLKNDISVDNPTADTLLELRRKLIALDALINDISKMLSGYVNFHPKDVDEMKTLTTSHQIFTTYVANMQLELAKLKQDFNKLTPEFTDRKKQALIEIEALLQAAAMCIANIEKGLSAFTTPLTFNIKKQLLLTFNEFEKQIVKLTQCMEQANNKMVTQIDLLNNADLTRHTRLGAHPNYFLSARSRTSQSEPTTSLDEKRMTL